MADIMRKTAFEVLSEVEEGAYLNLALKKHLRSIPELQMRRQITAIVSSAIEQICFIDYIIDSFTPGKRIHRSIRNILRLGAAQLLFLDGIAPHAAVNETVKLTSLVKKPQLRGFVNAVLRRIEKEGRSVPLPDKNTQLSRYLSIKYSYPVWIVEYYLSIYGAEKTEALLSYRKSDAETCVRPNRTKISRSSFERELEKTSTIYRQGQWMSDAYYIKGLTNLEENPLYQKGLFTVQAEASMLTVLAADIDASCAVLDVCAAPGGKTAFAAQWKPRALCARELHPHRAALMQRHFDLLGIRAQVQVADATKPDPAIAGTFDRVLVDAPCSALGLLYRKPDVKWHKKEEDISALMQTQRMILEAASGAVAPGGYLLYSTCTVSRRENEDQIAAFISRHPEFTLAPLTKIPEQLAKQQGTYGLQLLPYRDGIDGFFIAKLKRG